MDNLNRPLVGAEIGDLIDMAEIDQDIKDGFIDVSVNRDDPDFGIYNYTPKTQFSREWTPTRKICRGLIIRRIGDRAGVIHAKPFPKFFNHDEPGADLPLVTYQGGIIYDVYDKLDGSLGVAYRDKVGNVRVASKGSFHSEQADFANEWLSSRGGLRDKLETVIFNKLTPCFEIIYPSDRKVVDYRNSRKLMVIGFIAYNGFRVLDSVDYPKEYNVSKVMFNGDDPVSLIGGDWDNREGYVVDWFDTNTMRQGRYKLKFPEYVRLHRIVTGLNEKAVWEILCEKGEPGIIELKSSVPEEFHPWVDSLANPMIEQAIFDVNLLRGLYLDLKFSGAEFSRKNWALYVQKNRPELLGMAMLKFPELGDSNEMMKFDYRRLKPINKKKI